MFDVPSSPFHNSAGQAELHRQHVGESADQTEETQRRQIKHPATVSCADTLSITSTHPQINITSLCVTGGQHQPTGAAGHRLSRAFVVSTKVTSLTFAHSFWRWLQRTSAVRFCFQVREGVWEVGAWRHRFNSEQLRTSRLLVLKNLRVKQRHTARASSQSAVSLCQFVESNKVCLVSF